MSVDAAEQDASNPSAPAAPLMTRRQLREAESVAHAPRGVRRSTSAGRPAVVTETPRSRRAASPAAGERRSRRIWRHLITVAVVPGLFATAALPAYAATVDTETDAISYAADTSSGQRLTVSAAAVASVVDRNGVTPTSDEEMAARKADPRRTARAAEYEASGAVALGDDYPWPLEKSDDEGGGLSPLNYYYRECVDFVAWRLNRDAGSTSAPWKYTWSDLTPNGGNASAWAGNWKSHGWATGSEPVPGSVAWFNGNHVAYVKAVTDDGQVVIEEYNHGSTHKYGVRTIPVSQVALFLYAPPR
ncbi:MAG: CHAP domain-containing protein [Naasia sp.]